MIAFLAIGMWPWHAFADSLSRGTTALSGNAALIGQIAIPRGWLVLVPTLGAALIHTASFALVVVMLTLMGKTVLGMGWWTALAAMVLAPLNVFFRDVGTLLPQVLTFWMLLTPIFFDRSTLRPDLGQWLAFNPMTGLIEALRAGLLHGETNLSAFWGPAVFTGMLVLFATLTARRFLARIEDFL